MRIDSTETVKIGDDVLWEGAPYEVITKAKHNLVLKDENGKAWSVNLKDPVNFVETIDSDEDRQRLHDERMMEDQGATVEMGPVGTVKDAWQAVKEGVTRPPTGAGPAATLLEESLEILVERGRRYDNERGSPSITTTAKLWDAYIEGFARSGGPLTEVEVCEMIALHKIARRLQDRAGRDHHPDMINYMALAGGFAREDQK